MKPIRHAGDIISAGHISHKKVYTANLRITLEKAPAALN